MKKLLLTLGTVAAVAAPVASVVACGESTELQTPEFQQLTVAGVTFDADKTPSVVIKLKGFVFVTMKTGTDKTFLVPLKDVTKVAAVTADDLKGTPAKATLKDIDGNILYTVTKTSGQPDKKTPRTTDKVQDAYTEITGDSVAITGYATGNKVDSVIEGSRVALATKDQVKNIEAGKASAVTVLTSADDAKDFITANATGVLATLQKVDPKALFDHKDATATGGYATYSPLENAANSLFNDLFKKQAEPEKLAADKKAEIAKLTKPTPIAAGATPTDAQKAEIDLYNKEVALINGAADQDALALAIANVSKIK